MAWNAPIPRLLAVGTTIDSSEGETTRTMDFVDMKDSFRLSRIRQPRATLAAILLLAAVFIAFGVFADQALPSVGASNHVGADVDFIPAWLHIQTIFDPWKP